MTEIEWNNDQIKVLIEEYKKIPELWDRDNPKYRDQIAKYEAWCKLAKIFQCEVYDIKKKCNSIFASHRREKSRVKRGLSTNWFLYNHLSFLPHHLKCDVNTQLIKKRRKKERFEEVEVEEELHHEDGESEDEFEDGGNESPLEVVIKKEPNTPVSRIKYVNRKSRQKSTFKRRVNNSHIPERNRVLKRNICRRPEEYSRNKDECESFGDYIAISLKKHDERTRSMIKQAINNILFEQEMKKYNNEENFVLGIQNPLSDECEK